MRAIAVNEYGAMPALVEVPDPQAGPGQVLIKVEAAGINPRDRMIADGALQPIGPAQFPLVLGVDLAGIVEAVGEGAGRFAPGEELFGQLLIAPWGSAGSHSEGRGGRGAPSGGAWRSVRPSRWRACRGVSILLWPQPCRPPAQPRLRSSNRSSR